MKIFDQKSSTLYSNVHWCYEKFKHLCLIDIWKVSNQNTIFHVRKMENIQFHWKLNKFHPSCWLSISTFETFQFLFKGRMTSIHKKKVQTDNLKLKMVANKSFRSSIVSRNVLSKETAIFYFQAVSVEGTFIQSDNPD